MRADGLHLSPYRPLNPLIGNPPGNSYIVTAGAALMRFLGGPAWSMVLLGAALLVWVIVPLTIAIRLVRGQDI